MSIGNTYENSLQLLLFNNSNIANLGDATGVRGSSSAGSLYYFLSTAWPGEAGNASTSEASYTSYARVAAARSSGGFTVTNNSVSPAANVDFPKCTGGSNTIYFAGITDQSSGTSPIMYIGGVGGYAITPFVGTDTSTMLLTIPSHGFSADDRIVFYTAEGVTLPTGITEGTVYYVLSSGLTTHQFKISTSSGGSAVSITGVGSGLAQKIVPISVSNTVIPRLDTTSTFKLD